MLLSSMLFVGIIPAFIYSWVSNEKLSTVALSQISQGLSSRTELAAQNIDDIIAKRLLSIKTLANSPVFELASESVKTDEGFLSHYLSELTTVDTAFSEFYLLERDQVKNSTYAVVESSQEHSTQNLTRELKLAGVSQLSNVADRLNTSYGDVYISQPRDLDNTPFIYLITAAKHQHPEQESQLKQKLLVVKYELSELNNQLTFLGERISDTDYIILIDQKGNVILSGKHQGHSLQVFENFQQNYKQNDTDGHSSTSEIMHYTDRYNEPLIATVTRLGTTGNDSQPLWSLVSITPQNTVTQAVDYLHRYFMLALILTAGVVIILSIALTKRITMPLAKLSRFAAQFKLGNYARNDRIEGPHELQVLHDALNQGADKISYDTERLNRALHKAEAADRAKSAFLANLSHEIRTPMNGMLGLSQLLLKTELTEEQEHHLRTLLDSGKHMMSLLNDILDFSKIEQGQLKLDQTNFCFTDLVGTIESTYYSLAKEKGIGFDIRCEFNQNDWFYADKARIRQILFNLINNAIKFTERGKVQVTLKLENGENPGEKTLTIITQDTGIGIDSERVQYIFDPFAQAEASTSRRFGGTGLGLSIVKQLAELMNGRISLDSVPGAGSTFTVTLGIHQGQYMLPEQESVEFDHRAFANLKVLIVEDNNLNVLIIDSFLKQRGFQTCVAENGADALSILENEFFDVILMDNHMPIMDGIEATARIRALQSPISQIPIFACTADVFEETQKNMIVAGVDCVITKPLDEQKLLDALQRFKNKITHMALLRAAQEAEREPDNTQEEELQTDVSIGGNIMNDELFREIIENDCSEISNNNSNNEGPLNPDSFQQIDLTALLDMMDQDHDIIMQFLQMFAEEHSQDIGKLKHALTQDDYDSAILLSHSLKGASGSISAVYVREAALVIEKKVKASKQPTESELSQLDELLHKLIEEIHQQVEITI
ncbi:hybrid sensor histidine kinase/response regulator [Photobacterium chitinilyticum]|uniref:histidine kinase n=2 Tax=Photobacterium chitinilyticum TaxID=2485123 RepID=A0A444JTN2_9GAMM|nr:hybrid sensor histidine kinase/response regulator [Photobacterium chitinilyticum]